MELRQRDCHAALDGYVSLCEEQFAAHDARGLSCEAPRQRDCRAALGGCALWYAEHTEGEKSFVECTVVVGNTVALMADELSHLPFAVGLSRQTSRIIRQNLWYSLGMVAIPATILGLNIGFAVLLHEGSTLVVVFNALRLLIYNDDNPFD